MIIDDQTERMKYLDSEISQRSNVPQTGLAKLRAYLKDKFVDAQCRPQRSVRTRDRFRSLPISPNGSFINK